MSWHFALDSLAARSRSLVGWGWCMDTERRWVGMDIVLRLADGSSAVVSCQPTGMRDDLREAFPQTPHAAGSGFFFRSVMAADLLPDGDAEFRIRFEHGDPHVVTLRDFPRAFLSTPAATTGAAGLVGKAFARWREAGVAGLARGARALLSRRRAQAEERRRQRALRRRARGATLVFDHAMGGGANRYRDACIADWVAQGRTVLCITPDIARLEYRLQSHGCGADALPLVFADFDATLNAISGVAFGEVHVNDLVGFETPLRVLDWCRTHRDRGATLHFHLHDFHAVCPAFTLIGVGGRYCGVPEASICATCLPNNARNTLGVETSRDIGEWRGHWRAFLERCDEILAFSPSSVGILRKVYPTLADARIRVRPHATPQVAARPAAPVRRDPALVVGVIGHISVPKGADMLLDMAARARQRALPIRFVVIGTLEGVVPEGDPILALGSYAPDALPALIERTGLHVCLLPSVCPETYSYVTDEIMQMNLPLAVFDIGAPAERVSKYARGVVIGRIDADAALDALLRLADREYNTIQQEDAQ